MLNHLSMMEDNLQSLEDNLQSLINQVKIIYSSPNLESHYLEYFKRQVTKIEAGAPEIVKKVILCTYDVSFFSSLSFYAKNLLIYRWRKHVPN